MKRRSKIIIAVLLFVPSFVGLNVFVPIYRHDHKGYNCKLCAANKLEETVHIWGLPIYKKMGSAKRTAYTELYDRYIAETHEHQWAGGGLGRYVRYLFAGGIHKDGIHNTEYSLYQHRLSCDVLSVMALFEDEPLDFRRELYHELIECEEPEDYERVRELIEAIRSDPHNGRKLYEMYAQRKTKQFGTNG